MASPDHTQPAPNPRRSGWKTTVDLDRITWGELRHLVTLAAHMDDDDTIEFEWDDLDEVPYPVGIILRGER